jgi:ABC-type transport system substrate-binding protein
MRRRLLALGVVLATLSGCALTSEQVGQPPDAPAGARKGGVLNVGVSSPGGIDPFNAYEPAGKLISSTMCDTIVAIDPVTGQVREALARGWVLQKDGVTLKLRHGLRFNNGSELKSDDVNYSLGQMVLAANGVYTAELAKQFVSSAGNTQGDVLADPSKAPDVAFPVSKFDLQVVNRANDGGVVRTFAEPAMAPVSGDDHESDPAAFERSPVCVGPYVLETPYKGGDNQIALKRSESYYAKNVAYTSGGVGYPDRIVFTIYPSLDAAVEGYQKGEVDVVQVPRDQVAQVADTASLVFGRANAVEYVGLPGASDSPFADADVRIALSQAIDRKKLAAEVFGPSSQVATGFEPPALAITEGKSLQGKTTKGAPLTSCGNSTPARPDVESARAALVRVPKALQGFTLEVNDDAPYPAMADAIAAQWRENLGLDVQVVKTPWEQYVAKGTGGVGMATPFRIRWATDAVSPYTTYNDRQSFLGTLLGAESTNYGNWARWQDRTFQFGLSEEVAALTDVKQRGVTFNKLAQRLCDQMPMIPLVFDRPAFLVRSTAVGSARKIPVGRNGVLLLRELYLKRQS